MKIARLDLLRFGAFEDRRLDLSGGHRGLHVVHGPNEAGKSTALRAVRGLLFGIPERTADDFRHEMRDLRIGASLVTDDGAVLEVIRRKGRSRTLLEADGRTVADEAVFLAMVGPTTESVYLGAFGLDHASLRQGGADLLRGAGDLGAALFGAGFGAARLRALQAELDREIDDLWRPRAQNPRLNALLREHRDCQQRLRGESVAESVWRELEGALHDARRAADDAQSAVGEQVQRVSRLARLRRTAGPAREWRALTAELEAFGDLPEVAGDFGSRRDRLDAAIDAEVARLHRETARRTELAGELRATELSDEDRDLLDARDRFDELAGRFGPYRTDREAIGSHPDDGAPVPDDPDRAAEAVAELRRLADTRAALADDLESERADLAAAAAARDGLQAELDRTPEPGDTGELEGALAEAEPSLRAADTLREGRAQAASDATDLDQRLAALGRWGADAAALATARLPALATVRDAVRGAEERAHDAGRRRERRAEAEARIARCDRDLDALARGGEVPSPTALPSARGGRDALWREIRVRWLGDPPAADRFDGDDARLAAAHEDAARAADRVADLLRDRAEAVARRAALEADRTDAERARDGCDRADTAAAAADESARADWLAVWSDLPVEVGTPAEMQEWLQHAEALRADLRKLASARAGLAEREREIGLARARVAAALSGCGLDGGTEPSIAALVRRAREAVEQAREAQGRRSRLEKDLAHTVAASDAAARRTERATAKLDEWHARWRQHARVVQLDPDADPATTASELTRVERAIDRELRRRRMAAFEAELDRFVRTTAPTLAGQPADEVFQQLRGRIRDAGEAAARRTVLASQLEQVDGELRDAEAKLADRRGERERLLRPVAAAVTRDGVVDEAALDRLVARLDARHALRQRLATCTAQLESGGDGLALDVLLDEATDQEPDRLNAEHDAAARALESLRTRDKEAAQELDRAERALAAVDGRDAAARIGEQLESLAAEMVEEARRLRVLTAARTLLRIEIERYRAAHQQPVLARARELFGILSCGEFVDLDTDHDDDAVKLLAVRADAGRSRHPALAGRRVGIDGLSDGTRDQLFLALKVASIETLIETGATRRLPVVLDDVLVHFDDDRSRAAIEVFARLAATTQVLLFTHHAHVAELARAVARDLGPPAGIFVHELGGEAAAHAPAG